MPRTRWGVCPEPGCPVMTRNGRCDAHRAAAWSTSDRRSELPTNWAAIRRRVMLRDRYLCFGCGNRATDVHHIDDPHDHRDRNLAAICSGCHDSETLAEAAEGRRRAYQ